MFKLFEVELPKFNKEKAGQVTWRESFEGTCHANTESIHYRTFDGEMSIDNLFSKTEDHLLDEPEMYQFILKLCQWIGIVELGRVTMVNLKAGGEVLGHRDEGAYADRFQRFHVVFETDPKVLVYINDEDPFHMEEAGVYEFPRKEFHSVINNSDKDRWHLIFDGKLL